MDHQIWAAHNPYDLAQDLLTTPLFISVGNGQPGPLNPGGTLDRVEEALHAENVAFRARLTQVGAAATFDFYGPGSHDWRTGSASCTAPGPSSATHSPEPHQTGSDLR
jgi:diacylglycerol O-acyltransferase / trehalose O-mycolyltransferase